MRLVIFSDIHGNDYALDAFLKKIEQIRYDRLVFCGDIFGYYYNQKQIIEKLLKRKDLIWLKGNHDQYFWELYHDKREKEYYVHNYGHCYDNLKEQYSEDEAVLINSHSSEYVLETEGCKIGIFHGTPENSLEGRLYPDKPVLSERAYACYDIVILGHTHCRMKRVEGKTLIINAGSLGQPRDGKGYSFAVVDTVLKTVEFDNVEIDKTLLYKQIEKNDPTLDKLKRVLERGV